MGGKDGANIYLKRGEYPKYLRNLYVTLEQNKPKEAKQSDSKNRQKI